jgi:lipoate-protein ligase A
VTLARRKSGGGCVYQDLGNSVFSFLNPISGFDKVDFKTMNNDLLLGSLKKFGLEAKASGRNDLVIEHEGVEKKISGSAYKLKLGNIKTGVGKKSLHHGTMLLDLELNALGKYLNPSKAKLASKGVESVVSRVINLKQLAPEITHESFCDAIEETFVRKWDTGAGINKRTLSVKELEQIPELMEIYRESEAWEWRFGETPEFSNSLEKKFDWALVDMQFDVEKGVIVKGQCFSDCLVPPYIDAINDILAQGKVTYDVEGIKSMCDQLRQIFADDSANEMNQTLKGKYTTEL